MSEMTTANNGPLQWGEARELNPLETLMWRVEADPRLRSPMILIELLDRTPEWERLRSACEWGTRMAPRFRQKVLEPALGLGTPTWVTDPDFDLDYHVRRVALPSGSDFTTFLRTAEQVSMTPLDRARAPWEVVLFEGLPDGKAAFMLKMHHVATDGLGGVQLLGQLHSRQRESNPDKPQPSAPPPERATAGALLRQQLGRDLSALPSLVRQGVSTLRQVSDPVGWVRNAATYSASFRRVLADPPVDNSALLAGRSLSFRFCALDVRFADLRAAAKAGGGSLNAAYIAALLGAFRRYHEAHDRPVDAIPMAMPVSVRRNDDAQGGNRFVGIRFAGPVAVADPKARMIAIHDRVRQILDEPAVDAVSVLAPALSWVPATFLPALTGSLTKNNDLQATNVPGLREPRYLAGARIDRAYGFGPLPGCASMISLITHLDQCCIAVNVDPAAVTDVPLFGRCLVEGFEEVLSLAPGAEAPVLRI